MGKLIFVTLLAIAFSVGATDVQAGCRNGSCSKPRAAVRKVVTVPKKIVKAVGKCVCGANCKCTTKNSCGCK